MNKIIQEKIKYNNIINKNYDKLNDNINYQVKNQINYIKNVPIMRQITPDKHNNYHNQIGIKGSMNNNQKINRFERPKTPDIKPKINQPIIIKKK